MRIPAVIDKALAIGFGTVMAAAILWSLLASTDSKRAVNVDAATVTPRHKDLVLMDEVRAVNADASLLMLSPYLSFSVDEPIPCLIARNMKEKPEVPSRTLEQVASDQSKECEFVRVARRATHPVFERIASSRALPSGLFAFEAFHADAWASVGVFDQMTTCAAVQQEAMRLGIGTKACAAWVPRF